VNARAHADLAGLASVFVTAVIAVRFAITAGPRPRAHSVLDEVSLAELLDGGEVEANEFARCPAEDRTTFHAVRRDGSRRCWTCNAESAAGVA
jgi:hypothetical protein